MAMFGRNRMSAGLDIGSGFIKLVVLDHSGDEPEVVRLTTSPLVPDAIVEGEIMDPILVTETLRSVLDGADLKKTDVVAAVGGHDVIIKRIQMDRMSEPDARDVIRWEAEQHVPFDMESVQLDFQILDPDGNGAQMDVLLVAAKRELIENRMGLLADADVAAKIVDIDAFALHNAFALNYPDGTAGLIALLNIGHETTNINLLQDGVPVLVRDIPFGSRRLREALQRERGMTAEAAEEAIQGHDGGVDLDAFVRARSEELAIGVERATAFVGAQSGGGQLGRVFMCGGGARVPGIVDAMGERLSVRTEIANPLQRLAIRPEILQSTNIEELAPMLMLPVGLALRKAA
ncbi:MAG: type IV pilus assembly protein PilM [Gemmatimonadota bacterium]